MKLPYRYYGDPILRQKAESVSEITPELRELVANMIETLQSKPGWGLAAPQVGHSLRIFVTCAPDSRVERAEEFGPIRVYINPKLSKPSEETRTHAEGCFSVPGIYPVITRPAGITVEAMDLDGQTFVKELWGWQARVIMHENDHLNGVFHIDRMPANERKKLEPDLRELKKRGR